MKKVYDITHVLGNDTAPWPGDTPFRLELTWRMAEGASVNVSAVTLSPHNGTHADSPFHYDDGGAPMDQVPLEPFIGPARLVALEGRRSITLADLQALDLSGVTRLLIRTGSCPDLLAFHQDFTFLEPEAVEYLGLGGVRLLGLDSHSVDPADSQELPAHQACRRAGIMILENLALARVPPGDYELIALPLRLAGADASPVRAILRERI